MANLMGPWGSEPLPPPTQLELFPRQYTVKVDHEGRAAGLAIFGAASNAYMVVQDPPAPSPKNPIEEYYQTMRDAAGLRKHMTPPSGVDGNVTVGIVNPGHTYTDPLPSGETYEEYERKLRDAHKQAKEMMKAENSGLSVNYYTVYINNPNQAEAPYTAECSDIIEALGMTFNEGEEFKEIWRQAAQRTLGKMKAGNSPQRSVEKRFHFARRDYVLVTGKQPT